MQPILTTKDKPTPKTHSTLISWHLTGGYNVISTKLAKLTKIYFFETTRNDIMIPE